MSDDMTKKPENLNISKPVHESGSHTEDRIKEIRERCEKAQALEVVRHYSLAEGCDAWLELRPLYEKAVNQDVPFLLSEVNRLDPAKQFHLLHAQNRELRSANARLKGLLGEAEEKLKRAKRAYEVLRNPPPGPVDPPTCTECWKPVNLYRGGCRCPQELRGV